MNGQNMNGIIVLQMDSISEEPDLGGIGRSLAHNATGSRIDTILHGVQSATANWYLSYHIIKQIQITASLEKRL